MATNNQINNDTPGVDGTGSYAGSTDAEFTTPVLGAATATTVNFGASSTLGVVGTTTNNNAATGSVGEYVSSSVLVGSAVSLTSPNAITVTSISLGAGDWVISGTIWFEAAAGTTSTNQQASVSLVDNTHANWTIGEAFAASSQVVTGSQTLAMSTGSARYSLSGTTTIYLVASATFAVSTMTAYGFIGARRVR